MTDPVIEVKNVKLGFPVARYRSRGVKEAFLALVRGSRHPDRNAMFWAVNGVSLQVQAGEVLGMLGRNGSGKSTLLRVIAGIYAPDAGEIITRGRISSLLELGAGFKDELNGYENVKLSGAIMGFSRAEVEELLPKVVEFSGLRDFMQQPLKTYSSGMRARLGFAVASNVDPDILLIDEALAVGDASFREKSMQRVEALVKDDSTTVVVVSHNHTELRRLCSRMVLLERGELISEGDAKTVLAAYDDVLKADAPVRAKA